MLTWGKDVASAGPSNTGTGFEVCVAASEDTCKSEGEKGPKRKKCIKRAKRLPV